MFSNQSDSIDSDRTPKEATSSSPSNLGEAGAEGATVADQNMSSRSSVQRKKSLRTTKSEERISLKISSSYHIPVAIKAGIQYQKTSL